MRIYNAVYKNSIMVNMKDIRTRKIIHVDMDAFFAAVEVRDNPSLQGRPVAVGGRSDRRGVIATASYEARRFGVRSAMSTAEAMRRCPQLVLVPGRMNAYKLVSSKVHEIFSRYTSVTEPLSLDEAFLDVTFCEQFQGSATRIAEHIRADIYRETGLTASAGVAPNKFLAKIASDENKPNGLFIITPEQAADFAAQLPLRKIPGVGPKSAERMAKLGMHIGADVLAHTPEQLAQWLGKFGPVLYQRAQGVDERPVQTHRIRKSVGVETTLDKDLHTVEQCRMVLTGLLPELQKRLKGRAFKGMQIKLKFHDFQQTTAAGSARGLDPSVIEAALCVAFERAKGRRIRLVGISVQLANNEQLKQLSLPF